MSWLIIALIAVLFISGAVYLAANPEDQYRDRITCEHFKAEGVMVQEQDVHFHVYYRDGRRVAVSGVCIAEFGVIAEAGEAAK